MTSKHTKRSRKTASAQSRRLQRLVGRMAMLEWGGEVHECLIVKIHKAGKVATIAHVRDEKVIESFCAIAELKFNPSNNQAET